MGYVYIYQYLHLLFFIGVLLSVLFTKLSSIKYTIILLIYILMAWVLIGCFIKNTYENFIEWKYDNNPDRYKDIVKHSNYTFKDKKMETYKKKYKCLDINENNDVAQWIPSISTEKKKNVIWWAALTIFFLLCFIRYYYEFDIFISSDLPLTFTLFISLLYFILLIIPAFHHYIITKYSKVFVIYLFYLVYIIYGSYYYFIVL